MAGTLPRALLSMLSAIVVLFAAVLFSAPTAAHAAENGELLDARLTPSSLAYGSTGQLEFGWQFLAGTTVGDTLFIEAADDFELSAPAAFPDGQDIYSDGGTLIATITVTNNSVTVTRKVDTEGWGDIFSVDDVSVPFTYIGDIQGGDSRATVWPATNGPRTIMITGEGSRPAWYGPSKSGTFKFSEFGQPQIRWTFKSPIGPVAASEAQLVDSVGPGQVLECDSFEGTVRWWDQSYAEGRDAWISSFAWAGGAPERCDESGFAGVLAQAIPAPETGGNEDIPEAHRPQRVAYVVLNYTTTITDLDRATIGWDNVMNWTTPGATSTHPGKVVFGGTATGNRAVKVSNLATGPERLFAGKTFEVEVDCVVDSASATGYPKTLSVGPNSYRFVYAPIGSVCESIGDNTHGAEVSTSGPLTVTDGLTATFEQTVTNVFTADAILENPVVTQAVCAVPGSVSGPEVTPAANGGGVNYVVVGEVAAGETVTVWGVREPGYRWPAVMPEGWRAQSDITAAYEVTLDAAPSCPPDVVPGPDVPPADGGVTPKPAPPATPGAGDQLAKTGSDSLSAAPLLAVAGLVMGGATLILRRRTQA